MAIIVMPLTNGAWGYPNRGDGRRYTPFILAVLHDTDNPSLPIATAVQERTYANRTGSNGPSATLYIDRDGSGVRALDASTQCAWGSGDIQNPDASNAGAAKVAWLNGPSTIYNGNEAIYEQVEVVANYSHNLPWTDAQFETVARVLADASKRTGIPVSRTTVLLHSDLNSVSRASDPWASSIREANMARVLARANAMLTEEAMRAFVVTGASGSIVVNSDAQHAAVPLDGVSAFQKLTGGQSFSIALPIKLAAAVPGGVAGEDRVNGYLVSLGSLACIVLAKDSTFTPTPPVVQTVEKVVPDPVVVQKLEAAKSKAAEIVAL